MRQREIQRETEREREKEMRTRKRKILYVTEKGNAGEAERCLKGKVKRQPGDFSLTVLRSLAAKTELLGLPTCQRTNKRNIPLPTCQRTNKRNIPFANRLIRLVRKCRPFYIT